LSIWIIHRHAIFVAQSLLCVRKTDPMLFEIALRFDWIKFKLLIVIMHTEYIHYKFFRIAHGVGSYEGKNRLPVGFL